jgi:predicted O-methyltransferase YrrM
MTDGSDDHKLARDMIDVHGREAATVARGNARAAAVAGQAIQARSWIRVLGMIQRQQQADKASAIGTASGLSTGNPKL